MRPEEPYPPLTWGTLWQAWCVTIFAWVLTDGTWALAGGDWLEVPFWVELVNAGVLNAAFWRWRWERMQRQQRVSEEDPG